MRKTRQLTKRLAALFLCLALALTYVPAAVFAEEQTAGAPATDEQIDEAKAAAEAAKVQMDEAAAERDKAVAAYEAAAAEAKNASDKAAADKSAAEQAAKDRDDAFAKELSDAREAYEAAQQAYEDARQALDAADEEVELKTAAYSDAEKEVGTAETAVSDAETAKNSAEQAVEDADKVVKKAQSTLTSANNAWDKAKTDAAKAVEDAQADYDKAGRLFIDKKINDQGGHDLDDMITACKTYTSAAFGRAGTDADGNTYATVADAAKSKYFESIVDKACTYENLMKDVEYIREANAHRNLSIHNAGTLKVSYQLMGTAIISNTISVFATGHNLIKGDTDWAFWQSGNSMTCGENLAYASYSPERGWDPFHGWYYDERIVALAGDSTPSASLVNQVLGESVTNGYPYDPLSTYGQTAEEYAAGLGNVTGHYTSLINSEFKATGFAYVDGSEAGIYNYPGWKMSYVAAQEFNGDTSKSVTVDQYKQEIEDWFKSYKTALEDAKTALVSAQNKPQAVADAEDALSAAEQTLASAQSSLTESEEALADAQTNLSIAKDAAQNAQSELSAAQAARDQKNSALTSAANEKQAAEAAYTKAQSLDPGNPDTYKDYPELKAAVEKADTMAGIAAGSDIDAAKAQGDADRAKIEADAAQADLDQKTQVYESAQQAYEAAVDSRKAQITKVKIKGAVYTGKAIEPAVTVSAMLDGQEVTLTEDDYTVTYANNKAVGLATATVEGKGNAKGTISATFKIVPKKTSLVKVTPGRKAFTAKWKKQSVQTTGYQLQYSLSSKFKKAKTVTVKGPKKLYRTVKKLKGGKRYYVRVRTYKTVSGKKYVSAWSKKRAVKTKR